MSAQKARNVVRLERDGLGVCAIVDPGQGGPEYQVPIDLLSRPELSKAAKLAFPEADGSRWLRETNDAIRLAIESGELPAHFGADRPNRFPGNCEVCLTPVEAEGGTLTGTKATGFRVRCPEHPSDVVAAPAPVQTAPAVYTAPVPVPFGATAASELEAAIRRIAEGAVVVGGVDEAAVRAIVKSELAEFEAPAIRVDVSLNGGPAKAVEGAAHAELPTLLKVLESGAHAFLVGPAGSGKSTLAYQAAKAIELEFHSLSLGPTTPTSKVFGYQNATGGYVSTPFRRAYEDGGLFLCDELDNGHPGLVAELNQALANGHAAFADGMIERHPRFRFVATGNTFGRGPDRLFVGRNILDAATLDRFVTLDIPVDEALERTLVLAHTTPETEADAFKLLEIVQHARHRAAELKLPVVLSPRASIEGAKLLAVGLPFAKVLEVRVWAGIPAETVAKLER